MLLHCLYCYLLWLKHLLHKSKTSRLGIHIKHIASIVSIQFFCNERFIKKGNLISINDVIGKIGTSSKINFYLLTYNVLLIFHWSIIFKKLEILFLRQYLPAAEYLIYYWLWLYFILFLSNLYKPFHELSSLLNPCSRKTIFMSYPSCFLIKT